MLSNYVIKRCVLTGLAVGASVLAGCHSSPLGPPHDVAYFKAHADERKAVIQTCANDPGTYAVESNCTNAFEADKQAMYSAPNTVPTPPDSLVTQGFTAPVSAPPLPKDRLIGSPAPASTVGNKDKSH